MNSSVDDLKQLTKTVQPSQLSLAGTSLVSLLLIAVLSFPQLFKLYGFAEYIQYMRTEPDDIWQRYAEATQALNSSDLAADASVFVIWGTAGLIGYALVSSILHAVHNVVEFERDVEYFKNDRWMTIRMALVHILIRLSAASAMVGLYFLVSGVVIPGVAAAIQTAFTESFGVATIYYAVSFVVLSVTLHLYVILTRLLLLRTRVFYGKYYAAE